MMERYPTLFWFGIRFQVRYGNAGQIKILSCHTQNTEGYTVQQNQEKFKISKSKFEFSNVLEVFRQKGSKCKEKNNRFKLIFLCLDMEWNGYLYTGFRWENGWPTEAGSNTITGPALPGSSAPAVLAAPTALSTAPPSPELDTTPLVSTVQPSVAATGQLQLQPNIGIQVNSQEQHSKEEKGDIKSNCTGTSYITSQVSDESEDEADKQNTMSHGQVALGSGYVQCHAASEAGSVGSVMDISCNENMLSSEKKKADRIGTLENSLDPDIQNCFKVPELRKTEMWSINSCPVRSTR
jgi:hypothetical protein